VDKEWIRSFQTYEVNLQFFVGRDWYFQFLLGV
jgi:hypothetical protein